MKKAWEQLLGELIGRVLVWISVLLWGAAITCFFLGSVGAELGLKSLSFEACFWLWIVGDRVVSHVAWVAWRFAKLRHS